MSMFLKRLSPLAVLIVAVCVLTAAPGQAQIPIPILPTSSPTPTATPKPTPKPTPTSTSTPKPKPGGGGGSGGGSTGGSTGGGSSGGSTGGGSGGGSGAKADPRPPMPPEVARALNDWLTRAKSPAHTTTRLLELIDKTTGKGAPTFAQQRRGFGHFPVVGYVWYQDDYGAPRFKYYYHLHEGTDLFAVTGTPVTAAVDGTIWQLKTSHDRGKSIFLLAPDGTYFFYGHLGKFAKGLKVGQHVRAGAPIGRIGTSKDAQGSYPHCHFEVHPTGTSATVNPKPLLDAWLAEAESSAARTLGSLRQRDLLAPLGAANWNELFAMLAEPMAAPPAFWAAAYDGTGSTAAFADLALADLLSGNDWNSVVPRLEGPSDPLVRLLQEDDGAPSGD